MGIVARAFLFLVCFCLFPAEKPSQTARLVVFAGIGLWRCRSGRGGGASELIEFRLHQRARRDLQGPPIRRCGLFRLAHLLEGIAQHVEGFGIARIDFEYLFADQ